MDPGPLFTTPIAHRGLHDREAGIIENSRGAVAAAIAAGYAIEVDVQLSGDGVPLVLHDHALERLTGRPGTVADYAAGALSQMILTGSAGGDAIWPLQELLHLVGGRAPLVIEIKSQWTGDMRLAEAVASIVAGYSGPIGLKSFDPMVVARVRRVAPGVLRGLIGNRIGTQNEHGPRVSKRNAACNLAYIPASRPHFLSWDVNDLANSLLRFARRRFALPVMTWTVRTPAEQAHAALEADQMIFEGFRP
jgi:glycerophosphoryl diester phosphodiesterase